MSFATELFAAAKETGLADTPLNSRLQRWESICRTAANRKILNAPSREGWTAAHLLAESAADTEFFSIAHSAGMDFGAHDRDGALPLHWAADRPEETGGLVLRWMHREAGINIDEPVSGGWTALHLAAARDDEPRLKELLKLNAKIEARAGPDEQRPLHRAAARGAPSAVILLIAAGADLSARTARSGLSAADLAAQNPRVSGDRRVMDRLWTGRWPGDIRRFRAPSRD